MGVHSSWLHQRSPRRTLLPGVLTEDVTPLMAIWLVKSDHKIQLVGSKENKVRSRILVHSVKPCGVGELGRCSDEQVLAKDCKSSPPVTMRVAPLAGSVWVNQFRKLINVKFGFITLPSDMSEQIILIVTMQQRSQNLSLPAGTHIANLRTFD